MLKASPTTGPSPKDPGDSAAGLALESELFAVLGGDTKARIVARYLGLDGLGGTTMYSAGHEFGVSGERARQILSEVAKRLYGSRPFTPVLDRTISFLGQYIPGRAEEIEGKLFSEGLSAVPFRLEGLIRAAELLGRTPPFSVIPTKSLRLVYRRPGPVIKNIVRAGQRTIGHRGAATIGDVLVRLRDADQEGGPEFVEDVLSGEEDFHWTGPDRAVVLVIFRGAESDGQAHPEDPVGSQSGPHCGLASWDCQGLSHAGLPGAPRSAAGTLSANSRVAG